MLSLHFKQSRIESLLFTLQGEKAYSCAQCGTRFTYRNGLIKHTKLNRCPKKIITPEGETIIKKRSRTFGPSKTVNGSKDKSNPPEHSQPQQPIEQPPQPQLQPPPQPSVNGTLLVQNNQIQLQTHAGTYGLALLEDGSLIATPQQQHQVNSAPLPPPPPTVQPAEPQSHSKLLNQSVITALSAATGLSAQEISTWAANLPAGSTVKVTHHFDSHTTPPSKIASSSFDHVPPPHPPNAKAVMRPSAGISSEMASACCHDSLISSCVGLPSYQESFAVDPNEVLSKDRLVRTCHVEPSLANSRLLNVPELSTMSSDFDIDLDEIDDLDISLNDQEFTSIRSIVEQTFKDGRDVLDIISAV